MFFRAPPSSTPMTSSLVYTRKDPDIRMDWANFAFAISIPATTVDAGFPWMTSWARLGARKNANVGMEVGWQFLP